MRDLDAEIKHYKKVALLALTVGICLVIFAGWSLAGWAGIALAIGIPLASWGWDSSKILMEAESIGKTKP
jgi:hypothetical protein